MADLKKLADLLYPDCKLTIEDVEKKFPKRNIKDGACITRLAPSPTGFVHLGNLFPAVTCERLSHQSGGVFILRIEDTDQKREVEGAVEILLSSLERYNIIFDEGATASGEKGDYGPYYQRQRAEIYQAVAKKLISEGRAYPCFCSEQKLEDMRKAQEQNKENFGYYGKYASCRNLSYEEIEEKINNGEKFVLRFRSEGDPSKMDGIVDLIKGKLTFPENDIDHVMLKSDGIPTYHFAHAVDDHYMGTTHVVRGEEWLSTLPFHVQLFRALGFALPHYMHVAQLMKLDNGTKRKLSKRKDPEASLSYYYDQGFSANSVMEYIMTLLNSNFEEWRIENPTAPIDDFKFSADKMSVSGCLFDMDKLIDVSRNAISVMTADEVYSQVTAWAKDNDSELYNKLSENREYAIKIFSIGRGGEKPRKDIAKWNEVKDYVSFFYDDLFVQSGEFPENVTYEDRIEILSRYKDIYDSADDQQTWFNKVTELAESLGFAPKTKLYKKDPDAYKGHVGDVSMVLRVAITGRRNSPDLYEIMKILGADKVRERLESAK
ncbi:MAG: glutamate--tRNA ligase [Ruminococcaceae bacterium]|nr:glutamate--tRNA ligase [Oscillospiraceae bacterium]